MRSLLAIVFLILAPLPAVAASSIHQLAELTPSIRADQDSFGYAIAVSEDTVVVSEFHHVVDPYGAVYVYVKPASGWTNMTQTAKLTPSDAPSFFGTSVAIDGDIVVVGAVNPTGGVQGAVYVFVKPATGWQDMTETAKLVASDGLYGDGFGESVSISHGTIAIGAPFVNNNTGRAYVYTWQGTTWKEAAEIIASNIAEKAYFGYSVGISGSAVVSGAYGRANNSGAVYVYVEPADGWKSMTETAELTAPSTFSSLGLGWSVGISGNTIVAGAPWGRHVSGLAYVYVEPPGGWISTFHYTAKLGPPDSTTSASFGQDLAVGDDGLAIVVGAQAQGGSGAAYILGEPEAGWAHVKHALEITSSDGKELDFFGGCVGISGTTVVAGAPAVYTPGTAYVFGP